jgi:flagellar biosynthetic protein FlhB
MSDERDESQQTEQPTQRRLDEAREQGDVVKSAELSTFVVLLGGTLAIAMFGQSGAEGLARTLRSFLSEPETMGTSGTELMALMRGALWQTAIVLAPLFGVFFVAALAGHLIQGRPVFSAKSMSLDLSKLSPMKGLTKMFGFEGWMNLLKGLVKIAIVGIAIWTQLWPERGGLESILDHSAFGVSADMMHLLFKVMMASLIALGIIAGADYGLQYFRFMKRNRMSKQEIKDEYKQTEGDPVIKAKVRQIRLERAKTRMMAEVPKASVVIMNPTHYAVALKYESGKTAAPICVAKGLDALALKIRAVAEEHGVPVIENPPLARALHASVEIDEAIPAEHYKAVAQVIGYVMRLSGKLKRN